MERFFRWNGDRAAHQARSRTSFRLHERLLLSVLAAIFCLVAWFVERLPEPYHDL